MTWRYQMTHRTIKSPFPRDDDVYEVREVYENLNDDGSLAWTEEAMAPVSETRDGLIEVLQMMLRDVREFGVLEVDE